MTDEKAKAVPHEKVHAVSEKQHKALSDEQVKALFSDGSVMKATDTKLHAALLALAQRTSIDNDIVIKASIINSIMNQRHVDRIERRNQWYTLVVIVLTVVSVGFAWKQSQDATRLIARSNEMVAEEVKSQGQNRAIASNQLVLSLDTRISDPVNTRIIGAIEEGKPLRRTHGGKFSDYELDNFLAIFEITDQAYGDRLMSKDHLCAFFSYYLEKAHANREIAEYLTEIRKTQPDFYSGFDSLAKEISACSKPH